MSSESDSRLLLLMRHGKAESAVTTDHERDLTERGRAQARLVGDYLASQGVVPARVLVSDAVRTCATWQEVASRLPGVGGEVTHSARIYEGGPSDVMDLVRGCPAQQRVVLVVGHEPTMSTLTQVLADPDADSDPASLAQARIGLPTGAMSVLTASGAGWQGVDPGTMTLHTIVRG
jgi:phosphohistidine phosphatase